MYQPEAIDEAELTADFTKFGHLTSKDFLKAQRDFLKANKENARKMFLNYCLAIIHQKNQNILTIREAAYAIGNCTQPHLENDNLVQPILAEASNLQRHPSNYQASHTTGWKNLVKNISSLRKKIK